MSGLFTERCFLYNLLTSDVNAEIANVDEQFRSHKKSGKGVVYEIDPGIFNVDGGSDIEHVGLQNIQAHVQMVLAFISADIDPIESISKMDLRTFLKWTAIYLGCDHPWQRLKLHRLLVLHFYVARMMGIFYNISYSPEDDRFDLQQFLYNVSSPYQFSEDWINL
ncbi:hypothetical protein HAX54_028786 [Datura stramonium]|uniref:Uncharacterized protein n=1 Tax=Datura stramonium TaxID=4076 RepID=A0ABS8V7Z8_DATST|nr:hypothetical protein [Datura stramonium]